MKSSRADNSGVGSSTGGAAAAFGMARTRGPAEATEDLPPMRAVARMSQPAELQLSSDDGVPLFGKAPPMGLKLPGPLSLKGGLKHSTSQGLTVKKEWKDVTLNSCWKVSELELVPLNFPLERTHREINGADAQEVASRITNALRLLSIEAEYDGEKAKAKCRTCDLVSFRIRLFAGGEGGLPVMIEVQRRSGSPSSFMRSCRALLDAAEGQDFTSSPAPQSRKLPPFMKGPVGGMKCLESVVLKSDPVADMNSGIDKALEMLRSELRDVNLLALENLGNMADAIKTRPDIALKVAKKVILGEDCEIREEVAVMLQRDVFSPDDEDISPSSFAEKSHNCALVLFSNSLSLTSKDGSLAHAVKSQNWFTDFLIPSLLDEVRSCSTSANNSYEAACGLTSLASCSYVACRLMKECSALEDLEAARQFGLKHHELLANESERCLTVLGKSH
jgi:hypothetical protein